MRVARTDTVMQVRTPSLSSLVVGCRKEKGPGVLSSTRGRLPSHGSGSSSRAVAKARFGVSRRDVLCLQLRVLCLLQLSCGSRNAR